MYRTAYENHTESADEQRENITKLLVRVEQDIGDAWM